MNTLKLFAVAGAAVLTCGLAASAAASTVSTLTVPDATYAASLGKYANFTSVSYSGIGTFSDGYSSVSLGSQPAPFITPTPAARWRTAIPTSAATSPTMWGSTARLTARSFRSTSPTR